MNIKKTSLKLNDEQLEHICAKTEG